MEAPFVAGRLVQASMAAGCASEMEYPEACRHLSPLHVQFPPTLLPPLRMLEEEEVT